MPDRIIRDELLDSDRWLGLPTDTARLAYVGMLLRCDDFGNLEGGQFRMFRMFHQFTQIKTPEAAAATLLQLAEVDLVRRYEVVDRELYHLPRFKAGRNYLVRRVPKSPWCPSDDALGKHKRLITRGLAKNLPEDLRNVSEESQHVLSGVGVGVGVGVSQKRTSTAAPVDKSAASWTEHWKAKGKALLIESKPGESVGDYCRRVQQFVKAKT